MKQDQSHQQTDALRVEFENFSQAVDQRHERVNPCFMTGKGCVYTDQVDQALELRKKQEVYRGFMIMPFRPKLGVFFQNCLRPFFYANYDRDDNNNIGLQPKPNKFTLERADDVSRPGIIICEGICKRIQEANFVVADISVPNDNVFYELGLAYGIGHKILLIHQQYAEFGSKWGNYLRSKETDHAQHRVFEYDNLEIIKREQFEASEYVWKKPNSPNYSITHQEVLFFEMMKDGKMEPPLPPTTISDDDIRLSFKAHVMSDIGLALNRIGSTLKRQQEIGQSVIPNEYYNAPQKKDQVLNFKR